MAFYAKMLELQESLGLLGIPALVPEMDRHTNGGTVADERSLKRRLSMRHIRKVRDRHTFAIVVVNADKHGVRDYIGPNTFAEIAIALAHYKKIYLYQGVPKFYEDELSAWGATALYANLEVLRQSYLSQVSHSIERSRQLRLF